MLHSKLAEIAHVCTLFDLSVYTWRTRKSECTRVATFTLSWHPETDASKSAAGREQHMFATVQNEQHLSRRR